MPAHTNTMNKPKLLPFKHTNKTKNIDIYIVYSILCEHKADRLLRTNESPRTINNCNAVIPQISADGQADIRNKGYSVVVAHDLCSFRHHYGLL